jgi:hypothetical protein
MKVRQALNQYMFKRDVVLQTIGPVGEVTGEYLRNSEFIFDDRGRRVERVLFHPASSIHEMRITKEDIQDLAGAQLLGIDIVEATKYNLTYAGIEMVDARRLIAVDVTPLATPDPHHMSERFFVGRVWVDPVTFQIFKIRGVVEPQGKQRFPVFETWRGPAGDGLAFPIRTEADDVLHFRDRDVHYRIKVRYYDYKLFGSKLNITEIEGPAPGEIEVPSKTNETLTKTKAPARSQERTPIISEASPRIKDRSTNQLPAPEVALREKTAGCTTNRNAPPVGPYHWPVDTDVKVYFIRDMFTPEQRAALLDAMKTWTLVNQEIGSGVKFVDAGETETRMTCSGCLTIRRRDVYKQDKHHYAFFYPMSEDEGRLLVSAWIDLDFGITSSKALAGFMVHELAHGLGLWDCSTCKKKLTIMNAFPGINKNNGLVEPSPCDLETVKDVYQEERQVVALNNGIRLGDLGTFGVLVPAIALDKQSLSESNLHLSLSDRTASSSLSHQQTETVRAEGTPMSPADSNRAALAAYGCPRLGIDRPATTKSFAAAGPENTLFRNGRPRSLKNPPNFCQLEFPRPEVDRPLRSWLPSLWVTSGDLK